MCCRRWLLGATLVACGVGCDARDQLDRTHANTVGRFEPAELRDAGASAYQVPCTRAEIADTDNDAEVGKAGKLDLTFTPTPPVPGLVTRYNQPPNGDVNCGVVWIEDANGALVKTLDFWGGAICFGSLVDYISRFVGGCKIDVMTRPTMQAYTPLSIPWDGKSLHGKVVPDGGYTLVMDVQIDEAHLMQTVRVPFTKGSMPFVITLPPMPPQANFMLTYTPE